MFKKIFFIVVSILLLSLLFEQSSFSVSSRVNITIDRWQLKNKAKAYLVQRNQVPMLDISVVFAAGSAYDGKMPGLSSLTNAMMGEGAAGLSAGDIAMRLENVGAQFHHSVNRDMAILSLRTVTKEPQLHSAINTLRLILNKPNFKTSILQRQKKQLLTQLALQKENPWDLAKNTFYQSLYKQFSYANNPLGTKSGINKIAVKDINDFYHRYYTGSNVSIIMVGNVSRTRAEKIAKEIVGGLKKGVIPSTLKQPKLDQVATKKYVEISTRQSTIMLGQMAITRRSPYYFPLMVGNAVLGELPLSSILYHQIREDRGLAYFALSRFIPLKFKGPFLVALQTKASNTKNVLKILNEVLKNYIDKGPTKEALIAAKRNLIGRMQLTLSSNKNLMETLVNMVFYQWPLNYLATYPEKVNAVTSKDIIEAFQKTIKLNALLTVVVGPKVTGDHTP